MYLAEEITIGGFLMYDEFSPTIVYFEANLRTPPQLGGRRNHEL
jgi:hypothetical protein